MRKLELRELAVYFPYGLKVMIKDKVVELWMLCGSSAQTRPSIHGYTYCPFNDLKPILRPLADLHKDIKLNGNVFNPYRDINKILNDGVFEPHFNNIEFNEYGSLLIDFGDHDSGYSINLETIPVINYLLSLHFDLFNLIESGLAIDINTLNKE